MTLDRLYSPTIRGKPGRFAVSLAELQAAPILGSQFQVHGAVLPTSPFPEADIVGP